MTASVADIVSKRKRSEVMAAVRSYGNRSTELRFVALLCQHHITGWRRNQPLFGRPDFLFRKTRLAVFVDGCFWHCCPLHATQPATNRAFWGKKLARNKARDLLVNRTLRKAGWRVLRIWQHELARRNEARLARRIRAALR